MNAHDHDALPPDVAALASEFRDLPVPDAPEALHTRIAQSRESGLRVLVPDTPALDAVSRARRWPWVLMAGCAAGGAFVLWQQTPLSGTGRAAPTAVASQSADAITDSARVQADSTLPNSPESTSRQSLASFFAPWPQLAYAQNKSAAAPYAPLSNIDTKRLRFGERVFLRESANAYHDFVPHEIWQTKLSADKHNE
jgi:hypothetical protein